jgi:hypothetical protein
VAANADMFARTLAPPLDAIRSEGDLTLRSIATELKDWSIPTRRVGRGQVSSARNFLETLGYQAQAA